METLNENHQSNLIVAEPNVAEFKAIIKDIASNQNVLSLRGMHQHVYTSRYYHCLSVAYYTYAICKKFKLDYVSAARGAMLHDFYFYDWRDKNVEGQKKFHAFRHPKIALDNAIEIFNLNEIEQDIIKKHMWPLTLVPPKYPESFVITIVDKCCASHELFRGLKKYLKRKNIFIGF